jgi:hypothetical protein
MKSTESVKYERTKPIKVNEEWITVTTGHRKRWSQRPKRIKGSKNAQRRGATGKATECVCLASGMVVLVDRCGVDVGGADGRDVVTLGS